MPTNASNSQPVPPPASQQPAGQPATKSQLYIDALRRLGYSFRLNSLTDTIEIGGTPISDAFAARIRTDMRDNGWKAMDAIQDAYIAEAYRNRYNPITEYLNKQAYDGGKHIAKLASYFYDENGVFGLWLRKWMIGAVAKVFESAFNPMLVLDGGQGIGKSHFAKWLASPMPKYFIENAINPENKDDQIKMIGKWIWEVMELGATLRKADQEALKGFISTTEVDVRAPYGRYSIKKPSVASFIGTVNNSAGLFADPTGNRRFLVCKIISVDWAYTQLDPSDLWAEAMEAYVSKEPWTLAPDEVKKAAEINENYEVEDPIEGMLKKYYWVDSSQTWWTSTTDILSVLEQNGIKGTSRANSMALAGVATKLGIRKIKRNNQHGQLVWGYLGVKAI
jgi:predicted P-loop ATPase